MTRHASADELAELAEGVLRPRKAAKIAAHLASCAHCTEVSNQLASVSSMLAHVVAAPMPAQFSARIEDALAGESAHRLASEPATEAGRRDLPARGRHSGSTGRGLRIFGLSGPASRLVAAAGALVIIGGGGYELATHVNTGGNASATSGPAAAGIPAPMKIGPAITYHQASGNKSLATVSASTDFTSAHLGGQAVAALTTAKQRGVVASPPKGAAAHATLATPGSASASSFASTANGTSTTPSQSQLTGCVDKIAAGEAVLLVELAKFDGRDATIIMVASIKPVGSADVWAVGRGCSAGNTQVLDRAHVAHT